MQCCFIATKVFILLYGIVFLLLYCFRCICVGTTVGYQLISLASVDTHLEVLFNSLNKGEFYTMHGSIAQLVSVYSTEFA